MSISAVGHCSIHGTFSPTSAGGCPQCGGVTFSIPPALCATLHPVPVGAAPGPEPSEVTVFLGFDSWPHSLDGRLFFEHGQKVNATVTFELRNGVACYVIRPAVDHVAPAAAGESDEVRQLRDILSHIADAIGLAPYYGAYRVEDVLPRLRERLAGAAGEPPIRRVAIGADGQSASSDPPARPELWPLPDEEMPTDREWTDVEWLRNQAYLRDRVLQSYIDEVAELKAAPSAEREGLLSDLDGLIEAGDGYTLEVDDLTLLVKAAVALRTRPGEPDEAVRAVAVLVRHRTGGST